MGLEDGIKKTFLAGVGAVATTAEAAKQVVDTLAKKGEQAVEQGKAMKEAVKEANENAKSQYSQNQTSSSSDASDTF